MREFDDDLEAWRNSFMQDLWVFNKLVVAKKLGHVCGPVGAPVPYTGTYVVRPVMNILGMGRGAEKVFIRQGDDLSDRFDPSYFWSEHFEGRHLSIDFLEGEQFLCVEGFRDEAAPFYKWSRWRKMHNVQREVPTICKDLAKRYKWINIEEIGGKIIEIHLRRNWDFSDPAVEEIIPVWSDDQRRPTGKGWKFVPDRDYERLGFYIR